MTLSKNEMKNCPFCNSSDIKCDRDTDRPAEPWVCWCANCGSYGPNDIGWSGAVEIWNLRRPYDILEEEKIALELALRDLEKLFENEIGELEHE
jgi:hypothetical protein